MSEVLTTYTLDAKQPQAELERYRLRVRALTEAEEKAQIIASASAKQRKSELNAEEKALRGLLKLRKETNNPNIIKQYDEQIEASVQNIRALNKETRNTATAIKKVDGEVKKLSGSQKFFVNQLKQLGTAAAAAFSVRAIFNFAKESVKVYDLQLKAEAELLRALGNRQRVQQSLIIQAKERQKVTLFGDQETIQAQATIAAFVREEDSIKRLTIASQDFATAKGKSLAEAAELVTKTFASSTNSLTRYGIRVEGVAGSTERLESLTKALDAAFAGAAETAANTGTGPLTQLNNRLGDISERIGKELIPLLTGLAESVTDSLDALEGAGGKASRLVAQTLADAKLTIEDFRGIAVAAFDPLTFSADRAKANLDAAILSIEATGTAIQKSFLPALREARKELDAISNDSDTLAAPRTLAALQAELAEATRVMTEELERGSAAFFAQAAEVDRLKKQIETLLDPLKAAREAEEAARKEREAAEKAIDGLIQGLEKQRDQLTMTNEQILRNELVQLGANEATIFSTLLLREQVEALKAKEAAEKAQIALGEQLTASVLTDAEKEKAAIDEVNQAYANNAISFETLLRKREQIQAEADERRQKALDDEAKHQAELVKLAEDLVNEFGKTAEQLFMDTVDALKAQAEALKESGELLPEEFDKVIEGIEKRITEFSALTAQQVIGDLEGAVGSFKEFLTILGEDSAQFVEFQKVLTGIQIALDTAKAIAGVIAAASSTSLTPIDLAAKIVAGLAIVAVNMAKAKQLFSSAGDAPAPTYAKGGYTGKGIGHKDSTGEVVAGVVHAKEFVINKGETAKYKPMLEAINKGKWPEYFAQHYAPFAAIDARPSKAADKGFAANIAKALQIEFDDKLEGALKRIERKTGTTKVTNLHELGKYFKRNYWGPNTRN